MDVRAQLNPDMILDLALVYPYVCVTLFFARGGDVPEGSRNAHPRSPTHVSRDAAGQRNVSRKMRVGDGQSHCADAKG